MFGVVYENEYRARRRLSWCRESGIEGAVCAQTYNINSARLRWCCASNRIWIGGRRRGGKVGHKVSVARCAYAYSYREHQYQGVYVYSSRVARVFIRSHMTKCAVDCILKLRPRLMNSEDLTTLHFLARSRWTPEFQGLLGWLQDTPSRVQDFSSSKG